MYKHVPRPNSTAVLAIILTYSAVLFQFVLAVQRCANLNLAAAVY